MTLPEQELPEPPDQTASRPVVEPRAEFLSMLAHELRNPLAPIRNAAQVLHLLCTDPRERHAVDVISRQVAQLSRLVNDLLDTARLTRGLVRLEKKPVDVSVIATQALDTVRPQIDAREQNLYVTLPAQPVQLVCDQVRLIQVLENLLDNASRYSPKKGNIALTIAVQAQRLRMEVADNGKGIPADLLPHIFNVFAQAPQPLSRPSGGLGLGLAVVRNLVEMHGGSIAVRSAGPGRGSVFTVDLPLAPGA